MIDAVYTSEEMALLIEAVEHFHRYRRDYSGSYFEGVNTVVLVETCGGLLEAWRRITEPARRTWLERIKTPLAKLRNRSVMRIERTAGGYHVLAADRLLDLTFSGLSELRHETKYELLRYSENGSTAIRYRYGHRANVDEAQLASIAAAIARSCPKRAKDIKLS